ncbi:glycosyltransferase family 2 protein [Ammoniphilus sp. 3BR4]|uniref:glycosyltransferase family 2 protein n=1 Tax=Ammoniphilus sp. 3BR4 TaxID=3158265 RepID=UPI00346690DB
MQPEVSVVMAVFNGEDYLQEAVNSILKQTYRNFEFIIINDGSHYHTKEILDRIPDPRVKTYHFRKNRGVSFGRNFGIQKAIGRWIVLQDDDDISHPTRIEQQLRYIKSNPGLVAAGCLVQFIEGKTPVGEEFLKRHERKIDQFRTRKLINIRRFYGPPFCFS